MSAGAVWCGGLAALYGAAWGFFAGLIGGVTLALGSGLAVRPAIDAAVLAGAIAGVAVVFRHPTGRSLPYLIAIGLLALAIMIAITGGAPLAIPLDEAPALQIVTLLAIAAGLMAALRNCLRSLEHRTVNRHRIEYSMIAMFRGAGFVIFTVMVVLPFYVMIMTSLKNQQFLLNNPLDYSIDLSQDMADLFRSYVELFADYRFGQFLLTSAIVSVGTVLVTLMFAVPGAYAVARLRFKGRALTSRGILLIYMVPAIVLVIPLYAVFSQLGLRNSLIGLLIVYPATTLPVALYMLQGYFRGLPFELEEAGQMDGYSRPAVIWHITLPLSLPALATVALYVFMIAWNEFLFAFMFLDDVDTFTLSRGLVSLNSSEVPRQHLMAGAVIATIPVLVIFLWAERFLVKGLTAGSVKG